MGVLQPGDLPPHSFCRQIYHPEVKGGTPAEERRPRCGRSEGGGGGGRQVCFYVFSFLPFEKQGDLQVAHQGPESIKLARRELQPHV